MQAPQVKHEVKQLEEILTGFGEEKLLTQEILPGEKPVRDRALAGRDSVAAAGRVIDDSKAQEARASEEDLS